MLQVGVDCEEISRFRRLPYYRNEKFYRRIFTPREIEYCTSFRDPYQRFAARFAAKEAAIKALNNIAKPSYTEIEVQKDKYKDEPNIYIDKKKFERIRGLDISLSIAHSNSYAIAFAVITDGKKDKKKIKEALRKGISHARKKIPI